MDSDGHADLSLNEPVTEEAIKHAWHEYSIEVEPTNPRLFSILSNHIPVLKNDTTLLLELKNSMQESEIVKDKSRMFTFLKKRLKNINLTLEVVIVKDHSSQVNKAYTVTDKLKLMIDKNPSLNQFREAFDLDID